MAYENERGENVRFKDKKTNLKKKNYIYMLV
jgi:hypothetical protein